MTEVQLFVVVEGNWLVCCYADLTCILYSWRWTALLCALCRSYKVWVHFVFWIATPNLFYIRVTYI